MITVKKKGADVPFSRGIMASSIYRSGLSVSDAYVIVDEIERRLNQEDTDSITSEDMRNIVSGELLKRGYTREDILYKIRSKIRYLDQPVMILIGGAPGVGKSTIASELGFRLGINMVISTDTLREIMRMMLSRDLLPTLYTSSFMAGDIFGKYDIGDGLIFGYDAQVRRVSVGVDGVIMRNLKEGINTIINGVHVVPGYLDVEKYEKRNTILFQYVMSIDDLDRHVENFYSRAMDSMRDADRYVDNIDRIRDIDKYIVKMAENENVKVIDNTDFDETIGIILEDISTSLRDVKNV